MSRFLTFLINVFRGMNTYIASSNLPTYVMQHIENLVLTSTFGFLRKRKGNKKVIDTGITTLKAIGEFEDLNGGVNLVIQDGTGLKESEYSAGAYCAVGSITNDKRPSGSLVDEMYPIIHNNVLRSPAGIVSSYYVPFLYAYFDEATLWPGATGEETLAAGKYVVERFKTILDDYLTITVSMIGLDLYGGSGGDNLYGLADSLDKPWETSSKVVYIAPFTFDGQRLPAERVAQIAYADDVLDAPVSLHISVFVSSSVDASEYRNIKGIDVFVADYNEKTAEEKEYPAYFLQRIDFTEETSEPILRQTGTFETATNPSYIEFSLPAEDWESFDLEHYYIKFTYDSTEYIYKLTGRTYTNASGEKVRYSVLPDSSLSGKTVDCEIVSKFEGYPAYYRVVYDNYYRKLGSKMPDYLNAPEGDTGLDDYKHKYGCIAGGRYVAFGFSDGFGYYSPPYYYDVLYAQNIIKPVKTVVGCASFGKDVIIFYRDGASIVSIISNANIYQDDNFLDVGLVNQRALFKIGETEIFIMTYKGPYFISGRERKYIGQSIQTWFRKTGSKPYLSESTIESCVVAYNYLENQIDFIFQGSYVGDSGDYPDGITFTFDVNAFQQGFEPWVIKNTNATMNCAVQSVSGHMLTGSTEGDVYDWNNDNPDETFSTKLRIKLLKNSTFSKRKKMLFSRLFADVITDDTVTAKIYFDEATSPTVQTTLNSDGELPLQYIKESMEVELTTSGSANSVEHRGIGINLLPRKK